MFRASLRPSSGGRTAFHCLWFSVPFIRSCDAGESGGVMCALWRECCLTCLVDGRKDARNILRINWLRINHYLLHLVGLTFIYFRRNLLDLRKWNRRKPIEELQSLCRHHRITLKVQMSQWLKDAPWCVILARESLLDDRSMRTAVWQQEFQASTHVANDLKWFPHVVLSQWRTYVISTAY
jgi:hypothetical protein